MAEGRISPLFWKKVFKIFYSMKKPVQELFSGEYKSVFKGQGMEFSEVREYIPGDDVRSINWRLTAKYGKPFIKKFQEERELTIIILLDLSASLEFGTVRSKKEMAAELTSLFSWSAMTNNDRVGMLMFTDKVEKFVPPRKGRNQILELIRDALSYPVTGRGTDLKKALEYLNKMLKKRAVIFLISDFLSADFEKMLKVTAQKHTVIPIWLRDPLEKKIFERADFEMEDSETGKMFYLETGGIKRAEEILVWNEKALDGIFFRSALEYLPLWTDRPYFRDIYAFFQRRSHQR